MNVAIDLDGTVVFADSAEIAIPGRSSFSYLSNKSAALLAQLSQLCQLYVATARNALSVRAFSELLPDVRFAGFVMECGHVCRTDVYGKLQVLNERNNLEQLLKRKHADWEFVDGYEQIICTVASASTADAPSDIRQLLRDSRFSAWTVQAERHKTFLYPSSSCKLSGLRSMGVDVLDVAAGDAQIYDSSMLSAAIFPCALESADATLVSLVRQRNGLVVEGRSHGGAEVLLQRIVDHVGSRKITADSMSKF
jgi:hypothetical protein